MFDDYGNIREWYKFGIVSRGGWLLLCLCKDNSLKVRQKRFYITQHDDPPSLRSRKTHELRLNARSTLPFHSLIQPFIYSRSVQRSPRKQGRRKKEGSAAAMHPLAVTLHFCRGFFHARSWAALPCGAVCVWHKVWEAGGTGGGGAAGLKRQWGDFFLLLQDLHLR